MLDMMMKFVILLVFFVVCERTQITDVISQSRQKSYAHFVCDPSFHPVGTNSSSIITTQKQSACVGPSGLKGSKVICNYINFNEDKRRQYW